MKIATEQVRPQATRVLDFIERFNEDESDDALKQGTFDHRKDVISALAAHQR